ncbi:DUF4358 domain-containing protein [Pseudoflavonifractor capillosus]|uniref:DUF4358 domain-containing protein n=1 Tax=Pseudoflavonifractor capillosus TaxID=106588 RepID=UPI002A83E223|nr:DUF4358 domain-containing protein [Pseudoflavonifractor capillosus]MDY4662315.1 DUF4358 domain-containing protein [Pseudoflavonifractor capillosus]
MNKKFIALALSGALTLSLLAACGSPDAEGTTPPVSTPPATESLTPTPTPSPEVTPSETPEPTESAQPSETPEPSESTQPSESQQPSESPKPSETQKPSESPKPSETQKPSESPKPSESQQPSESPSASVVQSIWNEVADLDRPDMMDMDAALLSDLYGIESSDLVEFIGKMPLMSAHVNEFLIAQCAPGRVDAVKAACEARLETLKAGNMYPETLILLENYKLVTSGDYILFCIDEHADAMVEAFNTYAK